jgi:hypothetical protein
MREEITLSSGRRPEMVPAINLRILKLLLLKKVTNT